MNLSYIYVRIQVTRMLEFSEIQHSIVLLLVEHELLWCREEKNFLQPAWEDGALRCGLLMM